MSASAQQATSTSETQSQTTGPAAIADALPFGALSWCYGGLHANGAKQSAATISNLKMSKNGLSYKWAGPTLAAWGMADDDINAFACLFVMNAKGKWVGGKFDWISTSRTTRDFKNIYSGYDGWDLSDVPNPCPVAFLIVSADGKKRTNVLLSTWTR